MAGQFQNLNDLAAFLQSQAKANNQIDLDQSVIDARVSSVLLNALGRGDLKLNVPWQSIVVQGNQLQFAATTPSTAGDSFLGLLGTAANIAFSLQGASNEVNFTLVVTPGSDWTFGNSYPSLSQDAINDLAFGSPTFTLNTLEGATTVFGFSGTLPLSGTDNPVGDVLSMIPGAPSTVTMSGAIEGTAADPLFDLHGPLLQQGTTLGGVLKIDPPFLGVRLFDAPVAGSDSDSNGTYKLTRNYVGADFPFAGQQSPLEFVAGIYPSGGYSFLGILPTDPAGANLTDLASFAGEGAANGIVNLFNSVPFAKDFYDNYLSKIVFDYCYAQLTFNPVTLQFITVSVKSSQNWPILPDFSVGFQFIWTVTNPVSDTRQQTASLAVDFVFNKNYTFALTVTVPGFMVNGKYTGPAITWDTDQLNQELFNGQLSIPLDISVTFTGLSLAMSPPQKSYTLSVSAGGSVTLFNTQILAIQDAVLTITRTYPDGTTPNTAYSFNGTIYVLKLGFAVSATVGNGDTVFTIHMVDQTVGSLLTYLVSLVDPYLNLQLSAPWNKLNSISLDSLVLTINTTKGTVELDYPIDLNLGFVTLNKIGLVYQKATTDAKGVAVPSSLNVDLDCTFLGIEYGGNSDKPALGWNPVTDRGPNVPAGGTSLFDLQYLGLGQHVVPNIGDLATMQGIIQAMQKAMVPADQGSQNPLLLPGLKFDPTAGWLFGASFTVLGTVSIAAIFSDPNLAGVRISLAGAKADIFAGLAFEILYKRVTPTIGLYHIELQLPDAMRNLQFGEVSITLPIIDLDIYTNGNFRIDFGFPNGLDFSRSFSLQIFPFVGYGGFYFAWLTGATSQRVPQITNGQFNPVIEFGVALSIGVGKTIDEGVFSAGASITVIGIVQGVVAWFEPSVQTVKSDRYYWVQGTIAIMGKVYGKVDFKIIQVDVQIVASASVTLTIEAYMPIYIALNAQVSVQASVKILFVRIHFSFSLTLHLDFTIGSKGNPPWQVASGTNNPRQLRAQSATPHPVFPAHALQRASRMRSMNLLAAPGARPPMLQWTPRSVAHLVFGAAPAVQAIDLIVTPSFTVANGAVSAVLMLFVENAISPDATAATITQNSGSAADAAFNQLIARLFLWAVQSLDPQISSASDVITACDLQHILNALTDPSIDEGAFSYSNLQAFLAQNFVLRLVARTPDSQNALSGTVFPVPPGLVLTAGSYQADFSTQTPVSPAYQEQIDAYLAQLLVNYENEVEQSADDDPCGNVEPTSSAPNGATGDPSMATVIFQDYFVMLARAAVQAAITKMQSYPFVVTNPANTSLSTIAESFPAAEGQYMVTAADSAASLSARFGVAAGPVSPGTRLTVPVAVTAESVAASNRTQPGILQEGAPLSIAGVSLQVTANDTFETLATKLAQPQSFAASLLANNMNDPILASGFAAAVAAGTAAYTTQVGDTIRFVAAFYTVRLAGSSVFNQLTGLSGLVASLVQLNPGLSQYGTTGTLPDGTTVTLPSGTRTAAQNDTLTTIAAANLAAASNTLDLSGLIQGITTQNFPSNPPDPTAPLQAGTSLKMPALSYRTQTGDTVNGVVAKLGIGDAAGWGATLLGSTGLLQVSAVVLVPAFSYSIGSGDTLGSIAAKFNLGFDAFASSIAGQTGIFAAKAELTVANVPAQELGQLQQDLLSGGDFNNVATMVSRFLLHGLQLPQAESIGALETLHPQALANVATSPLYDLIGTQFALPAQTPDIVLTASAAGAVEFYMATYTVESGDTQSGIVSRFAPNAAAAFTAALEQLNPGVTWTSLPVGTVLQFPGATSYIAAGGETLASLTARFAVQANAAMFGSALTAENPGVNFQQPLVQGTEVLLPVITSYTVVEGDTLQSIAAQFVGADQESAYSAAVQALNPGVNFQSPLTPGTVLVLPQLTLWMPVSQLELSFSGSERQLISALTSAPFEPDVQLFTRLPLYAEAPVQYAMQHMLHWQWAEAPANSVLANSAESAGEPTIWPFPDTLEGALDGAAGAEPYLQLIESVTESASQPPSTSQVGCYQWGTTIDVTIRTAPGNTASGSLANQYLLVGAGAEGQQQLQELGQYLGTLPAQTPATITILYSANPSSANPSGLVSDVVNTAATAIVQANLSTVTESPSTALLQADAVTAQDSSPAHTASISEVADFIRLLWEGSITGGAGYYLNYVKPDGSGLPEALFTQGSEATLTFLVLIDEAFTPPAPPPIHSFHNCAVVGSNIDASTTNVFVSPVVHIVTATDSFNSITAEVASESGISISAAALATANQDSRSLLAIGATLNVPGGTHPVAYGETLGSIAAQYKTTAGALAASNPSAAIFQQGALMALNAGQLQQTASVPPGNTGFQLTRPNADPPASGETPQQVVESLFQLLAFQISENAGFHQSPQGLPAGPLSNDDTASNGLQTKFVGDAENPLWFYKKALPIYPFAVDALPAEPPAGFTGTLPSPWNNPYRGIGTNSQIVLDFAFRDIYGNTAPAANPVSNLTIPVGYYDDLIGVSNWPAVSGNYAFAAEGGAITLLLTFTFDYTRFVAAPGLSAVAATQAAASQTARYQQIYYQLQQADVTMSITSSLNQSGSTQQSYSIPKLALGSFAGAAYAFLSAAQNATQYSHLNAATDTFGGVASQYWTNTGDLAQANSATDVSLIFASPTLQIPQFYNFPYNGTLAESGLSVSTIIGNSAGMALNAGVDLSLASQPSSYTLQAGDTLRSIGTAMHAEPGSIAAANPTAPLTKNILLALNGVSIATGDSDSLSSMVTQFASQGVTTTAGDLGAANQDTPNLFDANQQATLSIADYVVQNGDSLASLPFDPTKLLNDNWSLLNIYPAGAALWQSNVPYTVQAGDTLASIATAHTVDLSSLAAQNAGLSLTAGANCKLLIPNQVIASATQGVGYVMQGSDTLTIVASKFNGTSAPQLVVLNRFTPSLFGAGSLVLGTITVPVTSSDTFDTLYSKAQQAGYSGQFADFATVAAAAPNLLAAGALVACPAATTLKNDTLNGIAKRFGLATAAVVGANAAVRALFAAGASISYQGKDLPLGGDDTLLTIAARFTALGVPVSLSDIANNAAFADAAILAEDSTLLIPPAAAAIPVPFTTTPANPELIFPVTVTLLIARNAALIDPDFSSVASVVSASTQLSPQFQGNGNDGALSLTQFAQGFEGAFPGLKAAVSKRSATGIETETNQLWAVDFRATGFRFQITSQPSYFSLAPLSTELLSYSNLQIQPYQSGTGLLPAQSMSFQAVDLDAWAQQFFSAVDAFLAPAPATAAFTASRSSLESILDSKSKLAPVIATGVELVTSASGGDASEAQKTFTQSLLASLSGAYKISTIVQLPVSVTSPFTDVQTAPRLAGTPVATGPARTASNGQSPSYSFSPAKIPLAPMNASGSELNFLLTVKTPEADRTLDVSLQFVITEMEFDISASGTIDGYQPSSWLSFLIPIDQNDPILGKDVNIGALSIPVPLHAYPSPPSVVAQSGAASQFTAPPSNLQQQIAQIQQWDYAFSFTQQSADQDTRNFTVTFNGPSANPVAKAQQANREILFTALAQFLTVYPALSSDLAIMASLPAGQTNAVATTAVQVFDQLVRGVLGAWPGLAALDAAASPGITFDYSMEVAPDGLSVTLTLADATNGVLFPSMAAVTANGVTPMPAIGGPSGNSQKYTYVAASQYQLTFSNLNLIQIQSGIGGVWVVRNQNIAVGVNTDFVYQTPVAAFSAADIPLLVVEDAIVLAVPQQQMNLQAALRNFLSLLVVAQSQSPITAPAATSFPIKVAVSYGYQPVLSQGNPVLITLPVLIEPLFTLTTDNCSAVAQQLSQNVLWWLNSHSPTKTNAALYFDLTMYLPSDTSETTPILQMRNIQYSMLNNPA